MDAKAVTTHLLRRAQWTAIRSSGPGGQHRDKASTQAELTLERDCLEGLEPSLAAKLGRGLGLQERPLRITVQDERSLVRNQDIAVQRLTERVARVLAPRRTRRPTRPSRSKRQTRLTAKSRRGGVKRLRRPPADLS